MSGDRYEHALASNGCLVSYSSCGHAETGSSLNIIDGSRSTFWATTGLYPQTFVLTFPDKVDVSCIKIRSYYVKHLVIEKSSDKRAKRFEEIKSLDLERTNLYHQVLDMDLDIFPAYHLRFTVKEGHEDFCAIYKVEVVGSSLRMLPPGRKVTELTASGPQLLVSSHHSSDRALSQSPEGK